MYNTLLDQWLELHWENYYNVDNYVKAYGGELQSQNVQIDLYG